MRRARPGAPPRVVVFTSGGRAWMRLDDGWLDLGPEADVAGLDPVALLVLVRDRLGKAVWHQVPRRLN